VAFFGDIGDRERAWHARAASKLMAELAEQIHGARADGEALVLQVGDHHATATVDLMGVRPTFSIATATLPQDAITIAPRKEMVWYAKAQDVARRVGDDDIAVECRDAALAALWLDDEVREVLPQLLWVHDVAVKDRVAIDGGRLRLGDGAVIAEPLARDLVHVAGVVDAAAVLATRPQRIARELAELAESLDGRATSAAWGLDGELALIFRRGDVEVVVDHVLAPRLTTRVRAGASEQRVDGVLDRARLADLLDQLAPAARGGPYR
jgi:hypothetical protein